MRACSVLCIFTEGPRNAHVLGFISRLVAGFMLFVHFVVDALDL
jgi:hypothetical protein